MGYTPFILILKPDLWEAQRDIEIHIEQRKPARKNQSEKTRLKEKAYDILFAATQDRGGFIIQGHKMLLIHSEFTSENQAVRELLYELNVEYSEEQNDIEK